MHEKWLAKYSDLLSMEKYNNKPAYEADEAKLKKFLKKQVKEHPPCPCNRSLKRALQASRS